MLQMHIYLKTSPAEYESLRLRLWLNFCEAKSLTAMEWQETLVNAGYNRWFNDQVEKAENRLIQKISPNWVNLSKSDLVQAWKDETVQLHRLFLRPVSENIRRNIKSFLMDSITGNELILN